MTTSRIPVSVKILDKTLQVGCSPDERDNLMRAADLVNNLLLEAGGTNGGADQERLVMLCALNLANDLIVAQQQTSVTDGVISSDLLERAEKALQASINPF